MSEDERPISANQRLGSVESLRYGIIDVLDCQRGQWVAVLVLLATWGSLAVWSPLWGGLLGWFPADAHN